MALLRSNGYMQLLALERETHQHHLPSRPEQTAVPVLQKGKHCVGGKSRCLGEKGWML